MIGTISFHHSSARIKNLFSYMVKGLDCGNSEILGGNMMWERIRPELSLRMVGSFKTVGHVSISFDDKDLINNSMLRSIAEDFLIRYLVYCRKSDIKRNIAKAVMRSTSIPKLSRMEHVNMYERINEHSYLVTRHHDTEHRHIHLAFDCQNIMDDFVAELRPIQFSKRLTEFILRQLELEYGLKSVRCSWEVRKEQGNKGIPLAPYYAKKLGFRGINRLRGIIMQAINNSSNFEEIKLYCSDRGINVQKIQNRLIYEYNGVYVKPLQLGNSYTLEKIQEVLYEKKCRHKDMGGKNNISDSEIYK
jgi:hypothetical protein